MPATARVPSVTLSSTAATRTTSIIVVVSRPRDGHGSSTLVGASCKVTETLPFGQLKHSPIRPAHMHSRRCRRPWTDNTHVTGLHMHCPCEPQSPQDSRQDSRARHRTRSNPHLLAHPGRQTSCSHPIRRWPAAPEHGHDTINQYNALHDLLAMPRDSKPGPELFKHLCNH